LRADLLPYLKLVTTGMNRDTLIEHKETIVVCEESGHVSLNYNVMLTTPKANTIFEPVLLVVTTKLILTCTNCDKIDHSVKTYHNMKKTVLVVPTIIVKSIEHVVETKTQPIKTRRILVRYPYIIYFSA